VIYRDGIPLFGQPGALPEEALEDLIGQAEALDMEDVRRRIAEAEQAAGDGAAAQ
jgi:thioredoxin 1